MIKVFENIELQTTNYENIKLQTTNNTEPSKQYCITETEEFTHAQQPCNRNYTSYTAGRQKRWCWVDLNFLGLPKIPRST